ncbi:MAG: ComEC/Rec2 family competence protein [Acidobacteria bacterium]|nr:ComEC/Rec2 family competence protein [Acidobacteriota bacterium]
MRAVAHQPEFSAFPLISLAASFACGVLAARFVAPPLSLCLASGAIVTTLSLLCFKLKKQVPATSFLIIAFACAGAALALEESQSVSEKRMRRFYERGDIASGEPVEVTGVLERAPEPAPDGLLFSLCVEGFRHGTQERAASGRIELFAPARDARTRAEYDALELRRGARVRVMSALARVDRYRNPGVSSLTEYLEARDVDARGAIKSPLLVERLDDERVFLPLVWLEDWRGWLASRFDRMFSSDTAGVLKAAMLGNRYGLSRATAERFREGGTFHVLVISGLHITFIGGIVWALAGWLTRRRAWRWAFTAAVVWGYAVAVGAEASVVRAALMFTVVALAPVLGRRASSLNALGGAALVLLVWRPRDLFDPSFQLTFLAVLAIVALAWPLLTNLKDIGEWRPTSATPYPPVCPRWLRFLGETLYWSERRWKREMERATHSYRPFKSTLAARLESWRLQRLLRHAFAAVLVSATVQLVLLPLLVLYFHRLSLASLLLNIVVGVLMAALSFAALAAVILSQLSAKLAVPLVRLAEMLNWLTAHSVDPFAKVHLASVRLPEYSGHAAVVYALYFVPLSALVYALARWRPVGPVPDADDVEAQTTRRNFVGLSFAALAVLFVVIVAHPLSAGRPDGRLRIDFLDVGQGDSALLTMPDGKTLLIDGGGRLNTTNPRGTREQDEEGVEPFERDTRGVGDAVVSEYLWWRGLDRVNYILATHADADHIDGLNDVAKNFRIDAALVARAPAGDPEFVRFALTARREGIHVYLVGRGDELRFGGAVVEVLWPAPVPDDDASPSQNNDSLVLRVRFGAKTFLLTGDIESGAESALVAARDDLHCDVIKVAHHGSRTSSTEAFVGATQPTLAVISVGTDSPYGHPHAEVLARWRAHNAEILTTGNSGTITVSTDGEDLKVETYVRP